MTIASFTGKYHFLSNFYVDEKGFCVENEFQAAKTLDPQEQLEIKLAHTPKLAKKLGREATLRPDWDQIKDDVMLYWIRKKFYDNHRLKVLLLLTGTEELIEGNYWNDTYWGICRGVGQNKLGQILMKVREELRNGDNRAAE